MTCRRFGKTGLDVSIVGFGSAPIGINAVEQQRTGEILNLLLDAGVNLIDTAASYHAAEEMIGTTVAHRRGEYILVSKCGGSLPDIDAPAWSQKLIIATIDRSLRRLKTDRLDVMLLHSCDLATLKKGEALAALVKARDAGKIRFAGYSGDNEPAAHAASLPDMHVIQTSINITDQVNLDTVLPKAHAAGLGVMAKRPLANAAWKPLQEQTGTFYQSYAATYTDRFRKMNLTPQQLGFHGPAGRGSSPPHHLWPEIALRFTLSFPDVHTAIIGTTNPDNARANLAAAAKGPLPEPALRQIRKAFRDADPGGSWRGLT